jgi:Peptidase family M28/PDZ domain
VLAQSLSKSLADLETEIDSDLIPRSTEIANWGAVGESNIEPSKLKLKNVVATLPGEGDLAKEFVVIGAHYDHVGMGGQGSLAPQTIAVHNGADDNASGTVSLLEVARTLKSTLSGNRRTIVFIAFSAEERGLIGSRYYVRNPRFALEDTVAMLNMDMVGRFTGDVLTVYGTGTGKELDSLLEEAIKSTPLGLEKIPFGYGPSDHQSFFEMKIPVLHFFTGLHNDYHRPSDDADKINVEGMATISAFVSNLATKIATDPQRISFIEVKGRAVPARQPPGKLGVEIEDNPTGEVGVIVRKTEPGKAAMNAGIIAGDMIVRMNGREVDSPRILTEILRNTLPGEIIDVEVIRDQQSKKFAVKLQR